MWGCNRDSTLKFICRQTMLMQLEVQRGTMTHGGKSTADITPFTKKSEPRLFRFGLLGARKFGAVSRFDLGLNVPTISQRASIFKACSEKGILGSQVPKELATGSMPLIQHV